MKRMGMLYHAESPDPVFSEHLALDMGTVEPSVAGPTRPQDRLALKDMPAAFAASLADRFEVEDSGKKVAVDLGEQGAIELDHGAVLIAAITSCTNTSNPSAMVGGGAVGAQRGRAGVSRFRLTSRPAWHRVAGSSPATSTRPTSPIA